VTTVPHEQPLPRDPPLRLTTSEEEPVSGSRSFTSLLDSPNQVRESRRRGDLGSLAERATNTEFSAGTRASLAACGSASRRRHRRDFSTRSPPPLRTPRGIALSNTRASPFEPSFSGCPPAARTFE
jgi:hypothetical protein